MAALVLGVLFLAQVWVFSCIAAEQGPRRAGRLLSESRVDGLEGFGKGNGGVGVSAVELQRGVGRKLLQQQSTDDMNDSKVRKQNNLQSSFFKPKHMAMAIPVAFVLCCALLCPCFQPRRKGSAEVLVKDPSSRDSTSSFGINFTSEKVSEIPFCTPASPLRAPASPLQVPPSPLRAPPSPSRFSMSPQMNRIKSVRVNMNEVNRATKNFSSALKIGEGGFATVYKAQLQDGQVVAIKRAKMEHFDALQTEFSSEVELLAKIEHRNLVKLLGCVEKGNERIIITEYVPNGTLREHLDGQHGTILDFNQRLEIAIDVAHGLTYLHLYAEKPVIHRDVKSSNILLTESMRAKVADFGFARLGLMEKDQSHIVTKVKGTAGYLDPQYMRTYQLTPKSDVYSFGILLIEILSGRRPVESKRNSEERVTVRWEHEEVLELTISILGLTREVFRIEMKEHVAFTKYNEGKAAEILDPQMKEMVNRKVVSKLLHLAFHCAAPTRLDRPTMKEVGELLWRIRSDYIISLKK